MGLWGHPPSVTDFLSPEPLQFLLTHRVEALNEFRNGIARQNGLFELSGSLSPHM